MKGNKKVILLITILVCSVALLYINKNVSRKKEISRRLKSVNLSTDYEIEQVLSDIKLLNVNAVNVPVVIEIPSLTSNDIKINQYSMEKAIQLIEILKKQDIYVILEAYPWINNGSEYETEYNPGDKERFFREWKDILYTLVKKIGNKKKVDIIIAGSNFTKLESYDNQWVNIIKYLKHRFNGIVTYKTSWWYTATWDEESNVKYDEKLNNKIFSEVDFISIAAYFELSDKPLNTKEELEDYLRNTEIYNRGQNVVQEVYNFYEKYNKLIYFGELGFPRREYATMAPWNSHVSEIDNGEEQARAFEAYKSVFLDEKFMKGASIFAVGQKGEDKFFYPSEESINVISKW